MLRWTVLSGRRWHGEGGGGGGGGVGVDGPDREEAGARSAAFT